MTVSVHEGNVTNSHTLMPEVTRLLHCRATGSIRQRIDASFLNEHLTYRLVGEVSATDIAAANRRRGPGMDAAALERGGR